MKNIIYSSLLVFLLIIAFGCQRRAATASDSDDSGTVKKSKSSNKVADKTSEANAAAIFEEAKAKMFAGDNQGAVDELTRLIESKPKNAADAYYWRAVAKYNLGNNTGYCDDYAKAAKLGHPSAAEMVEKYCKN